MTVFRIEDLDNKMCDKLESQNEELRKVISDLKSEIDLRDKRCEELESKNEELRKELDLEDKRCEELESKNEELWKVIILVNSLTSMIWSQV